MILKQWIVQTPIIAVCYQRLDVTLDKEIVPSADPRSGGLMLFKIQPNVLN